ncbi:hypothetical protein D1007_09011 [Hordeum vulgare]|nr:hypothetical protein D1007_09011 [Hordeum vulgare]
MPHAALLRPLIPPPLVPARPLTARCRRVRGRCAPGQGAGEGASGAEWLSSAVGEKVDELLRREENRALLDGVEAAERRVELARAKLADIERQEAAARLATEEVRRLERRRDEFAPTVFRSSVVLISCALFGVTFRYAVRRDLDNIQLKTGAAAAFAVVRGLALLESGRTFELSTDALMSLALDGAIGSREMALKVFSWLNRKMHSNAEYCTIDENKATEKEDSVCESVAEQDTEALLLRDVLLNGILAIGTLGHNVNSLCPDACHEQDEFIVMDIEKVEEEEYEEEKCGDKEDALATAPSEPEPAVEPAKMHSSSMKEYNFTCSLKEEILMCEVEVEDVAQIQERPLLMVEKVEKVRTTLADLFAAEAFSPSDTEEKSYEKTAIIAGASTSKPALCMEKTHKKKTIKPMPDPLKATRKLSRAVKKMLGKKIHPEQLNGRSNAEEPPLLGA